MFTRLRAMLYVIRRVGSARSVMEGVNIWARFCILEALQECGLLDYLREPRTYREIVDEFGFTVSDYTTDVLVTLANDHEGVLAFEDNKYRLKPDARLPTLEDVKRQVDPAILALNASRDLARQLPTRMRGESSAFAKRLERERGDMMSFDTMLTNRLYDAARGAALIWARPLIGDLDGKTLLDVGCGSGRETAHLWLLLGGKVKITAVDPVEDFVALGRERFASLVAELSQGQPHPPITEANAPDFQTMTAGDLHFPDAHFDMVFHSAMLHWTPNPQRAVSEMLRVLKPGGVIWGGLSYKPTASRYQDLLQRVSDNVAGFPWRDDVVQWHRAGGAEFDELVGGVYRAKKAG